MARKKKQEGEVHGKVGAPSKYDDSFIDQAYSQCLLGCTMKELASFFHVNIDTLYEWRKKYPKFSEAIKDGKRPADGMVAHAMFDKATGPEWVEQVAIKCKDIIYGDNGKKLKEIEHVEVVDLVKRAPPDTTAGIFWLKNRGNGKWRDKIDVGANVNLMESLIDTEKLDEETRRKIAMAYATSVAQGEPIQEDEEYTDD